MKNDYVLPFSKIRATDLPLVGGKGANLGEMTHAGFPIPDGFCVTTAAFDRFLTQIDSDGLYSQLDSIESGDVEAVRNIGRQIRKSLRETPMPADIAGSISAALCKTGEQKAYAVRSSATAEDLPDASFAGQQDTYLNVIGSDNLLEAVRNCWASLFTDRAILYRQKNGFEHRDVLLSVVVQEMVLPDISGILFTADPVTGHRQIASIDASYGLGEALVAGLVTPDLYQVDKRTLKLLKKQVADKKVMIRPLPSGNTIQETIPAEMQTAQVLTEQQAIQLTQIGSRIEAHYATPQDIEWAIADDVLYILQSRPITSLYPLPEPRPADDALHVYISLGHQQVMTDAMKPMGLSIWKLVFPIGKTNGMEQDSVYMHTAGGRLYPDLTVLLHTRLGKKMAPRLLDVIDPLIAQGLKEIVARPRFLAGRSSQHLPNPIATFALLGPILKRVFTTLWWDEPETKIETLNQVFSTQINAWLDELKEGQSISDQLRSGRSALVQAFAVMLPYFPPIVGSGMMANNLVVHLTKKRADPQDLAALGRGLMGNVTTDMDLAVGDLADLARQSPELVRHLQTAVPRTAIEAAQNIPGSQPFLDAWQSFMQTYGMRGGSEIDITRPRWREDYSPLIQVLVGNLQQTESGQHRAHHARLHAEGEAAAKRLAEVANYGLFGPIRKRVVARMARVARHVLPGREHGKFFAIQIFGLLKQVLWQAGEELAGNGRLATPSDIWFLSLHEAIDALDNPSMELQAIVGQRKVDFSRHQKMSPPRILTSDGEAPVLQFNRDNVPEGALVGSPVSAGIIEGIAKVVLDPTKEILGKGKILIAPFTDPGWTPLFINAAGLVMEVGGLMTHGSVVAREYGIPAVVGVIDCTKIIKTGQRIRVHGDQGYVEILD